MQGMGSDHASHVERRGRHVMTPLEGHMAGASKPLTVPTKQQRIAVSGTRRIADSLSVPPRRELMM